MRMLISAENILSLRVNLRAFFHELLRFCFHSLFERVFLSEAVFGSVFANVLGDAHRAEVGAAHGAEVGKLGAFGGQRLIVKFASRDRIEAQVELVLPAELETRFAQSVVAILSSGMTLGKISGVGGDFVGNDAILDV